MWDVPADHARGGERGRGRTGEMSGHPFARDRQGDREIRRQGELIRGPESEIRNFDEVDYDELLEPIRFHFALDRRGFVQLLGSGVLVTAIGTPVLAQFGGGGGRRGGRGRGGGGFFGGGPVAL